MTPAVPIALGQSFQRPFHNHLDGSATCGTIGRPRRSKRFGSTVGPEPSSAISEVSLS